MKTERETTITTKKNTSFITFIILTNVGLTSSPTEMIKSDKRTTKPHIKLTYSLVRVLAPLHPPPRHLPVTSRIKTVPDLNYKHYST